MKGDAAMYIIYEPRGPAREYAELAVNLRRGCPHGCKYCYVPGIPPWKFETNPKETFHSQCVTRSGLLRQLERECQQLAGDPREVLFCFTCDPYVVGADNSVTRAALLTFEKYNMRAQILTKGGMEAAEDFDILARNGWKFASTMLFSSEESRMEWEPKAAAVESRVKAIRKAHRMGIETWVSVEPVIYPNQALEVIRQLKGHVDLWKVGKLNHRPELEATVDWPKFLADVRTLLAGEPHLIKKDLLACDEDHSQTIPAGASTPRTPTRRVRASAQATRGWTPAFAEQWADNATPHVRTAIKVLTGSGQPMSTAELNAVSGGSSGGAITGGLNAWATRNGLPMPLVKRRVNGKAGYRFESEELNAMFARALT